MQFKDAIHSSNNIIADVLLPTCNRAVYPTEEISYSYTGDRQQNIKFYMYSELTMTILNKYMYTDHPPHYFPNFPMF